MSHKDRLISYADEFRCHLVEDRDRVALTGVECITAGGKIGLCDLSVVVNPETGDLLGVPSHAQHCVEVRFHDECDGRVYDQHRQPIGNVVYTDGVSTCCLSIKLGSPTNPKDYDDAFHCLGHYLKAIIGAVRAARVGQSTFVQADNPFTFASAFESRAGLQAMHDCVRGQSIAILGLGGTGSYILDLMVKTPVSHIHLFDGDALEEWNTFRSPSAPSACQLEAIQSGTTLKVDYYKARYDPFRKGIVAHGCHADTENIRALSDQRVSFAFVAIDPCENSRQDAVFEALDDAAIPFIDVGMSVHIRENRLAASLQVYSSPRSPRGRWREAIPNARLGDAGEADPYRNSQIAELNAMNAALAVMEWRKVTGQFESSRYIEVLRFKTSDASTVARCSESEG